MEGNNITEAGDKEKITFEIGLQKYTAVISAEKLLLSTNKDSGIFDYREQVASNLVRAIDSASKPNVADVKRQNDKFFTRIFDELIAGNTEFYAIYDTISCAEICEHYAIAYYKYRHRNEKNASLHDGKDYLKVLSGITEASNKLSQIINFSSLSLLEASVHNTISFFTENMDILIKNINTCFDNLSLISQSILSQITEKIKKFSFPQVSDERKQELINSYEQWGKYGWTVLPYAQINSFNCCPETLQEADRFALKYCKKSDMQRLFTELEEVCARKRDVREAVFCYNQRQYKACALILFSIIDSRFIRMQNKDDENYAVGVKAIVKYKKIVKQKISDSENLFLWLSYVNLFSCLFSFFENTNNFTKEPLTINRNYLDHGMSYKLVRKKDCIKLFLLLYNILNCIDDVR